MLIGTMDYYEAACMSGRNERYDSRKELFLNRCQHASRLTELNKNDDV
jgi:hypothetical protein